MVQLQRYCAACAVQPDLKYKDLNKVNHIYFDGPQLFLKFDKAVGAGGVTRCILVTHLL